MADKEQKWLFAKDFSDGNVCVRVTKLEAPRPRFSITVGRLNEEEALARHFGVFFDYIENHPTLRGSIANTIGRLVADAELWIEDQTRAAHENSVRKRNNRQS